MSVVSDAKVSVTPPGTPPAPITPTTTSAQDDTIFDFEGLDQVEQFVERQHLLTDAFEYSREGKDPGLVLIFNQENIPYEEERMGTRRDVNELILCLQRQGFNIGKDTVMHNSSADEIKKKLKEVSEMDLSEYNCLIVFFLTHGCNKDLLLTTSGLLYTVDIWRNFIQCKDLQDKPKMFVFQACKGGQFSTTTKTFITSESSELVQHESFSPTYIGPDMLVVYSAIEGNLSHRNPLTGTWFIQELCKNITAYGKRDDVFSIITRTTKCVSGNYFHREGGVNRKQMPVCMSTLSKKFYLNRNKDRALVLMSRKYYEDVLDNIKQINETVDTVLT